jgi:hypothetical protein
VGLGAGAGYGASLLTVPALAASATPGLPSVANPAVVLDRLVLGGFLGGLVIVLLVIVTIHGRRVWRLVTTPVEVEVAP